MDREQHILFKKEISEFLVHECYTGQTLQMVYLHSSLFRREQNNHCLTEENFQSNNSGLGEGGS